MNKQLVPPEGKGEYIDEAYKTLLERHGSDRNG